MNRKIIYTAKITVLTLISLSCGQQSDKNEQSDSNSSSIHITQTNFETEKMQIGTISEQIFEETVACRGEIVSPPNGRALLNPVLPGNIVEIKCSIGEFVTKGQVLVTLSSKELIVIQQDYIKALALLAQLNAEYKRRQTLHNEGISTDKEFLAIETEYKTVQADFKSLKLQLELLQLDIKKIEAGDLYKAFPIVAPINGHITNINVVLGQFVESQSEVLEIIDGKQLQIKLSVFEQDIKNVQIGNKVRFGYLNDTELSFNGTIEAIGRTLSSETKTIECCANINIQTKKPTINGSFVQAIIVTNSKLSNALPQQAVIKQGKNNHVFVVTKQDEEGIFLSRELISIGMVSENFVEVLDTNFKAPVLIKGNYNLPIN